MMREQDGWRNFFRQEEADMRWLGFLAALLGLCAAIPAAGQPVGAQNAFALDLYGKLAGQPGNFVLSPYSVSTTLGMVYAGAKGGTADEIARALHVDGAPPGAQGPVLETSDDLAFHSANALWLAPRYPARPGYIATVKDDFGGRVAIVDFRRGQRAADEINDWVAGQTERKIQNLVTPQMFSAATRLVLTNAVYFKAQWETAFHKEDDTQAPFHAAAGHDMMVKMMHQTGRFAFAQAGGVKILVMPYRGDASMAVVLPDRNDGLAAVEAGLSETALDAWMAAARPVRVAVSLPVFKETSRFSLNPMLEALGIGLAFDPARADFSGIAAVPGERLCISDAVHEAYIDVDETGTEAAAATAVVMMTMSMPIAAPPPVPFVADHPFLYIIRANSTGAILFMGRVDDPMQG